MKRGLSLLFLCLLLACMVVPVFAVQDSDSQGQDFSEIQSQDKGKSQEVSGESSSSKNDSVSGFLKDYSPVKGEDMAKADKMTKGFQGIIGNLIGVVLTLVTAWIGLITVCDLAYIAIPPIRSFLAFQSGSGGMSGGAMAGGFGGGFNPMGNQQGSSGSPFLNRQWVSDEVLAAFSASGTSGGMPTGGGFNNYGGFNNFGNMSMGQQNASPKSIVFVYLKKRAFFLVIFAITAVLLTSSLFFNCGVNIAEFVFTIFDKIKSSVSGLSV